MVRRHLAPALEPVLGAHAHQRDVLGGEGLDPDDARHSTSSDPVRAAQPPFRGGNSRVWRPWRKAAPAADRAALPMSNPGADDVAEGHRLREGKDNRLLASLRLAVEPQRPRLVAMRAGCLLHLKLRAVHDHVRHRARVTGAEAVVLLEPGEDLAVLGEALRGGLVDELLRGLAGLGFDIV